jgi:hypothetical protein
MKLINLKFIVATLAIALESGRVVADDFEGEPIRYSTAPTHNVVTRLEERLSSGKSKLVYEPHFGYLRSLLSEFNVPESSQMLVFSKTSLQRQRIRPRTPRAIYFNDEVYIGFCQNGEVMEISAVDPQLGTVFYTLRQAPAEKPRLVRQGETCLLCHGSSQNQGVPGHLVRSVFADSQGYPVLASGTYRIDQTSPLKHRWGGWYVTGTHGKQTHLGNLIVNGEENEQSVDNSAGMNVTDLAGRLDCSKYLSRHSDIVALMVLEHQAEGHNLIARANFQTRMALYQEAALNRDMGERPDHRWDSTLIRIRAAGEPLVKYLLFSEEAELTARIKGTSDFASEFAARGPVYKGRSLREFDLQRRLFKYPCSYLIYSPSFGCLPKPVKDYVLHRIWEVLTEQDKSKEFAHLTTADRLAIREILLGTKPDLPNYWR